MNPATSSNNGNMHKSCEICHPRDALAKYRCPRCAVGYCSITCYKSESHASCVELFQADSLKSPLQGQKASTESRQGVDFTLSTIHQNESMKDEPDIASRFQGLSLDSASPEDILARLTPSERKTIDDIVARGELPSSLVDVIPLGTPWWLSVPKPTIVILTNTSPASLEPATESIDSPLPALPESIPALPQDHPANPNLALNLLDILLAYATTARYMDGDMFADSFASASMVWDLSMILGGGTGPDMASFSYSDVDEFLEHAVETAVKYPRYFMAVTRLPILLRDIVHLLSTPASLLRALYHLVRLFDSVATTAKANFAVAMTPASQMVLKKQRRRAFLTQKKVEYYVMFAAWITGGHQLEMARQQGQVLLEMMIARLQAEVEGREMEEAQVSGLKEVIGARRDLLVGDALTQSATGKGESKVLIEETS